MTTNNGRVRLEVDANDLANWVGNHSAQSGATTGWSADVGIALASATNPTRSGQTLIGTYTGGKAVRVNPTGASHYTSEVRSPQFNVTPGHYVGLEFSVADSRVLQSATRLEITAQVEFLSGSTIVQSTTVAIYRINTDASPWTMQVVPTYYTPPAAPSGASTGRIAWQFADVSTANPSAKTKVSRDVYLAKVMVVQSGGGATPTAVRDVPFAEGAVWQNVLGGALNVRCQRGGEQRGPTDEIGPGMLTAVVKDASLDPAQNPRMRPGRAMQLTVLDTAATWQPIFTGRISELDVTYTDATQKGSITASPRITMTAVDAAVELGKVGQPFNYAGALGPKVKAIMAASTVPYATDAGTASTTPILMDENASVWDQMVLARNSFANANLWVDRAGTVRCVTDPPTGTPDLTLTDVPPVTLTNQVLNPSYESAATPHYLSGGGAPVTAAQSNLWADQGAQSLLISKTNTTSTLAILIGGTTAFDGSAPNRVAAVPGDWVSMRVAVKAVVAVRVQVLSVNYGGLGTVTLQTKELTAGQVATIEQTVQVPFGGTSAQLFLEVDGPGGAALAMSGPVFYVDGWTLCNTGRWRIQGPLPYVATTALHTPAHTPYTDIDVNFGGGTLVNELMVNKRNAAEPDGQKAYGPYIAAASRTDWGSATGEVTVVDGTPSTLAAHYLGRTAVPTIFPGDLMYHRDDAANDAAVLVDLYAEARVIYHPALVDTVVRVIGVEHDITPTRWRIRLRFRPQDVTTPTVTNPAGGANTGPLDVAGPAAGLPFGAQRGTVAQSIPNATFTTVTISGASDGLTGGMTFGSNAFTVPKAGVYMAAARVGWASNATGTRLMYIRRNGSALARYAAAATAAPTGNVGSLMIACDQGDTIDLQVYQTSGGALNTDSGAGGVGLSVAFLG